MTRAASPSVPPGLGSPVSISLTREELDAWGESLGARLTPPQVVTLSGELGAGKTTLVQAICRGYGVKSPVTSPTFAILHEYSGARSPVFHFDLYRLRDERDLLQLGWDELLTSEALILIEWPERAGDTLPVARMNVLLEHSPPNDAAETDRVRRLTVR